MAAAAAGSTARSRSCMAAAPTDASSVSRRARTVSSVPGNCKSSTTATIAGVGTAKGYGRRTAEGGNVHRRRVLLVTALIAGGATTGLLTTTSAGAGQAAPTFGTPAVANFWVPGFEPDVAVDRSPGSHPLYTTWPNGFSTTISYVARSDDGGRSFHFVEGNVVGKPTNCIGGGDSELQVSPVDGKLYFADL